MKTLIVTVAHNTQEFPEGTQSGGIRISLQGGPAPDLFGGSEEIGPEDVGNLGDVLGGGAAPASGPNSAPPVVDDPMGSDSLNSGGGTGGSSGEVPGPGTADMHGNNASGGNVDPTLNPALYGGALRPQAGDADYTLPRRYGAQLQANNGAAPMQPVATGRLSSDMARDQEQTIQHAPYVASFTVEPGDYTVTAEAVDERGNTLGSPVSTSITITDDSPDTVMLDVPASVSVQEAG